MCFVNMISSVLAGQQSSIIRCCFWWTIKKKKKKTSIKSCFASLHATQPFWTWGYTCKNTWLRSRLYCVCRCAWVPNCRKSPFSFSWLLRFMQLASISSCNCELLDVNPNTLFLCWHGINNVREKNKGAKQLAWLYKQIKWLLLPTKFFTAIGTHFSRWVAGAKTNTCCTYHQISFLY